MSIRYLTRSPIDMKAIICPAAITGKWRTRRRVMRDNAANALASGPTVTGGGRHYFLNGLLQNARPTFGDAVDNVTLRKYANNFSAIDDRQCANAALGQ